MATVAELRQRVGEELALITIGGTLKSQDNTRITDAYDEIYARLKKEGLAFWITTGPVPDQFVPYVALMMEENLLTAYSVPDARYKRIKADAGDDGKKAMMAITRLSLSDYASTDDAEDF